MKSKYDIIAHMNELTPVILREWQQMGSPEWDIDFLLDYRSRCSETIIRTPFIEGWTKEELVLLAKKEITGVDLILDKLTHK